MSHIGRPRIGDRTRRGTMPAWAVGGMVGVLNNDTGRDRRAVTRTERAGLGRQPCRSLRR